jgi:methyltransferase-like protein
MKAAMRVMDERWPGTVPFEELNQIVNAMLDAGKDFCETLALGLLNTYIAADLLELHSVPVKATKAGEKPHALPSVRYALTTGAPGAANLRHELFRPSDFDRKLIPLLDGREDRSVLLDKLTEMAVLGELTVQTNGQTLTDPASIRVALEPVLEKALLGYSNGALLI